MHDRHVAQPEGRFFMPYGRGGKPQLASNARVRIGKKLAQAFEPVLREPVPDLFLDLLDQIEHREKVVECRVPAMAEGDV